MSNRSLEDQLKKYKSKTSLMEKIDEDVVEKAT